MPDYRIGFVGVGRMGSNMARHLKDEGYTISAAYDVDGSRSAELASELGCEAASTPAGVAEASDTVITVVTDDDAMRAVFAEGADGLLEHAEGVTFINCATISPSVHVEVEGLVEARGGHSLEACMASSITQA
ncbi:NAD(P)-dependent oxidoreductase, partial [Candidatus Poribacteria bacterium]|nr:NAD(P)-dependent oxidoreductase [Candidatus Poribacteria bacterium]